MQHSIKAVIPLPLLALAMLAGCEQAQPGSPPTTIEHRLNNVDTAREFRLSTGTLCVATNQGGITCDWKREGVEK